jgi:hypothetical protein
MFAKDEYFTITDVFSTGNNGLKVNGVGCFQNGIRQAWSNYLVTIFF